MSATPGQLVLQTVANALPVLLFAVVGVVVMLRRRRIRRSPLVPPAIAPDGTTTVQVRGLYLHRGFFGGTSRNSINPRFAIAPDGIRFKLFRESRLPFSTIDHVDVREWFGSQHLLFVNATNPRLLSVNVGDRRTAKQILDALPGTVRLTPEAATIRDGTAAAGTSGLRRYRGRFA